MDLVREPHQAFQELGFLPFNLVVAAVAAVAAAQIMLGKMADQEAAE